MPLAWTVSCAPDASRIVVPTLPAEPFTAAIVIGPSTSVSAPEPLSANRFPPTIAVASSVAKASSLATDASSVARDVDDDLPAVRRDGFEGEERAVVIADHGVHVAVAVEVDKARRVAKGPVDAVERIGGAGQLVEGAAHIFERARGAGILTDHQIQIAVAVQVDEARSRYAFRAPGRRTDCRSRSAR